MSWFSNAQILSLQAERRGSCMPLIYASNMGGAVHGDLHIGISHEYGNTSDIRDDVVN